MFDQKPVTRFAFPQGLFRALVLIHLSLQTFLVLSERAHDSQDCGAGSERDDDREADEDVAGNSGLLDPTGGGRSNPAPFRVLESDQLIQRRLISIESAGLVL